MKLEFSILWFDDQPTQLIADKKRIGSHLSKQGFHPIIRHVKKVQDIDSLVPSLKKRMDPDLILMDWNMGQGTQGIALDGAEIAKKIRRKFKYQDIVFYSAEPPRRLREAVCSKDIDGVFCVNRSSLVPETKNIIDTILGKLLDLNQMRGIVMSRVSDFDSVLSNCLCEYHSNSTKEFQQRILADIHRMVRDYHAKQIKRLRKVRGNSNSLEEYNELLTVSTRYEFLLRLINENAPSNGCVDTIISDFKKFKDDVIVPRNALAHSQESMVEGKKVLKHKSRQYDIDSLKAILAKLSNYDENLNDIYDSIKSGTFSPIN